MSTPYTVRMGSTRLIVRDLEREAQFYRDVFGFGGDLRIQGTIGGRGIDEIIFLKPEGSGFILLSYDDGEAPGPGGVTLLFFVSDIEQLQAAVLAAGGAVFQPIGPIDLGGKQTRMAFFTDPEGFLLEVIEG